MVPFWNHWFPTESLADKLARALAERHAVDIKEFCESFEFFTRTRRVLRRPVMADLCCGHGLTGILFAVFERSVERVDLVDRRRPKSHDRIMSAAVSVAPWVSKKVQFFEESLSQYIPDPETGLLGVHACGSRTDQCLKLAQDHRLPIGVMPCCYSRTASGLQSCAFDEYVTASLAIDIDRTYRMQAADFTVRWKAIPRVVTQMNRIILALPEAQQLESE